jgi:hypothetical protein
MSKEASRLNAAATGAFCALFAAISFGPVLSQDVSERYRITARGSHYTVVKDPSKKEGYLKCVYRNEEEFLCPGAAEFIAFEKHIKTKDYDLIVLSTGQLGSGTRWWDWKLIVENGSKASIKTLADGCLECDIHVEGLKPRSNEVAFTYRQEKHRVVATFHAGQLAMRKSRLDPYEPLDKTTCDALFGNYQECRSPERNATDCKMAQANASHFGLLRTEDHYAGISYEGLGRLCKAACSTGKAMDRLTFFKHVCRRRL